ncbi:MAG: tetraacyldisaccharide 4'-kinase, partial [Tannerella sp.]|nr:tetraacyldisaccharide 4'-kinase [Tannerella sp.]
MKIDPPIKIYHALLPFSLLFGIGVWVRNLLFDLHLFPSRFFSIPVICVGNLAVGGTGKTPLVAYLIQLLSGKYRIARSE